MRSFRWFRRLSALLVLVLRLVILVDVALLGIGAAEYLVLHGIVPAAGGFAAVPDAGRVAELQRWAFPAQAGAHLLAGFLALLWIRQANKSARALGVGGFRFSPFGAAAWYFIPFFNFWKPLHAMAEIWHASRAGTAEWTMEALPRVFAAWWPLLFLANLSGRSALRLLVPPEGAEAVAAANRLALVSDTLSLLLTMSFLWLVRDVAFGQRLLAREAENRVADEAYDAPPHLPDLPAPAGAR